VVDAALLSVRERVVRGDAAVLAAHWRSHLAADFATDHVATGEDVLHIRAQEFIHADLVFLAKLNSGFFNADLAGVLAAARSHYQFLGAQLAPLIASLDLDDYFLSVLSHRAHDRAGSYFDSLFFENFADRLADFRLIAVGEQLLAALSIRGLAQADPGVQTRGAK